MKRNVLIPSIIVIVLAVVGFIVWQRVTASATNSSVKVQTTSVQLGTLAASVSAAGNISAPSQVALAFTSSGRVAQVNVKVGDLVKKNQVLLELDATDLNLSLKTAQVGLTSAQASYDQTKADLQFALRDAQANLTSAQASLDAAKAANAQNPNSLIVAKANLDTATITLHQAQAAYDQVAWQPNVGMSTQATTLQSATIAYQSALASYKIAAAAINDSALKQAQASFANAQTAVEQAQKDLDTKLVSAQATLDNAQVALTQAQRNLDNTKLVAPFDGAIAAVNFGVGDTASGTAVTLVDLSQLQVKVTIAEVDIAKIKVGQTAALTMDALSGKTYNAQVIAISPVGAVTSGVVNYTTTLALTDADNSIKPGMTANLTIEVERHDNVLLVPLRAVKTQGNQKVVTVQAQGQLVVTKVTTGLSNDTSIEITSGLQAGEVVLINQTTTRTNTNAGGGILGIGGGGPPPN